MPCGDGLVDVAGRDPVSGKAPPRLLGSYDPLLLGWMSREAVVGEHQHVVTVNGLFRPVAIVDGRVVASWGLADGVLTVQALEPIRPAALNALRADARDVLRFLGLPDRPAVVRSG